MKKYLSLFLALVVSLLSMQEAHAAAFGRVQVDATTKATYMAASALTTPVASTTDMFTITGSGTKTIKILRIDCAYAGTSASANTPVYLIKRSTAGSGGTATTETDVPLDSSFAAGTATVKTFTANPTVGTIIARIATMELQPPYNNANSTSINVTLFDHKITGAPVVLRGTSEQLAVNFNGTIPALGTPLLAFTVYWTEE